jgi:hypothetical protein
VGGGSLLSLVALLLKDQERPRTGGQRPSVEEYLQKCPQLAGDADAVVALLFNEFLLRARAGEQPQIEDYRRRFPQHADALITLLQTHYNLRPEISSESLAAAAQAEPSGPPTTRLPLESDRAGPDPPSLIHVPGYVILGTLGKGGMGVVYRARHMALERIVALKMILHAEHAGLEARQRFQIEAQPVARLQHPNIVQVYDVGRCQDLPYFSMELCAGGSLAEKLKGTPWEARAAVDLVVALARAIQAAHDAQQRYILYNKMACDALVGVQTGLVREWLMAIPMLLLFSWQVLVAGALWRRHQSAWVVTARYAEKVVPLMLALTVLQSLILAAVQLPSGADWMVRFQRLNWRLEALLVAVLLAQVAVWCRWPRRLRLVLHGLWIVLMPYALGIVG